LTNEKIARIIANTVCPATAMLKDAGQARVGDTRRMQKHGRGGGRRAENRYRRDCHYQRIEHRNRAFTIIKCYLLRIASPPRFSQ
jgi:hypothetical protein